MPAPISGRRVGGIHPSEPHKQLARGPYFQATDQTPLPSIRRDKLDQGTS
jgi:hypothetical protein